MTVTDLEIRFGYGHWANRKLFAVLPQLSTAQFTEPFAGDHGSIRNTLVHMLSAEWGWLERCGGPKRGAPLEADSYLTATAVMGAWTQQESRVREFLSTLRDADLARPIEFSLAGGPKQILPLGELLEHAANHGVHHRGQISLLLRLRGFAPENFDILFYFEERHCTPR